MLQEAIGRILLLHNMIFAFGGIPVIYMGDEIGLLNDESYVADPDLAGDNRWLHRPRMDWSLAESRVDPLTVTGRIFQGLLKLIRARKRCHALHGEAAAYPVWSGNERVFGLLRESPHGQLLILGNFAEVLQSVPALRLHELGFDGPLVNLIDGRELESWHDLKLGPYEAVWLEKER